MSVKTVTCDQLRKISVKNRRDVKYSLGFSEGDSNNFFIKFIRFSSKKEKLENLQFIYFGIGLKSLSDLSQDTKIFILKPQKKIQYVVMEKGIPKLNFNSVQLNYIVMKNYLLIIWFVYAVQQVFLTLLLFSNFIYLELFVR